MSRILILAFSFSISIVSPVISQVNLEWTACYNGSANDYDVARAICVDDSGHVYITGGSRHNGWFEYATIKYDLYGNQLWVKRFAESGNNIGGTDLVSDNRGNIYVSGKYLLKYNIGGELLWIINWIDRFYGASRIIFHDTYLYLGGTSIHGGKSEDYALVKYDTNSMFLWQQLYNGTANYSDQLHDMVMDSKGNIIVTGQSHGTGSFWDYATIKYSSDGDSLWVKRYNGPSSLFPGDYAYAITADDEDNIYVTGRSDGADIINNNAQCVTIAYSPEGDTLWENRYPLRDFAGYDVMYSKGFIYVVALSYNSGVDLIKYDKQGNTIWIVNAFPFGSPVHPAKLAADIDGYIYLSSVKNLSYAVLKISSSGSVVWEFQYPASPNPGSFVTSMAVDLKKNIYLTGQSIGWVCPGDNYDYLTLKLSQDKVNVSSNSELVSNYLLSQNYPNPFNPVTKIKFEIPRVVKTETQEVKLIVYDALGRIVTTLVDQKLSPGSYEVDFDGSKYNSGLYFYRLTTGNYSNSKKMLLLK